MKILIKVHEYMNRIMIEDVTTSLTVDTQSNTARNVISKI